MKKAFASVLLLIAASCSSTGQWRSAGQADTSAFPVAQDRFVIRYTGAPGMTSQEIRKQMLYRAAELTLRRGYFYFTMQDSRALDSGLGPNLLYGLPYSPTRRGDVIDPCNPEAEMGGGLTTIYGSSAVVQMLKEPTASSRVFDVRQVLAEFGATQQ